MPRSGPPLCSLWSDVGFSDGGTRPCRLEAVHPQRGNPWRAPVLLPRPEAEALAALLARATGEAWTPREEGD